MEESIKDNLTSDIWDVLGLKSVSPRQLSPLVLAYIGDSIFDLVVKTTPFRVRYRPAGSF